MSTVLTAFNDHFIEFVEDIQRVFPEDPDILTAKNSFLAIRKMNPQLLLKSWTHFVVGKYKNEIDSGNIDFFLNKDYSHDLTSSPVNNAGKIMEAIERIREPIKKMSLEEQAKTMKYIQNLTTLSSMYA
jgi:hypothetical protein